MYPALRVMPAGWQSACGLLQYFHRRLCFRPPPLGAGLDPSREIRRDMPLPRTMNKSRQDFFPVYLDVFSQAARPPSAGGSSARCHACQCFLARIGRDHRKSRRQNHQGDTYTGREIRRLGPLEHFHALPRSTLRPTWWRRREVYHSTGNKIRTTSGFWN